MSTWFGTFFRFPVLVFRVEPLIVASGTLAMMVSAMLGTLATLRVVVRVPPVVAMAPPAPIYRPTVIEHAGVLLRFCTPPVRMILRSVTGRPIRALLTVGGLALAIAIIVFGSFT